jgi:hypothetical protein
MTRRIREGWEITTGSLSIDSLVAGKLKVNSWPMQAPNPPESPREIDRNPLRAKSRNPGNHLALTHPKS